MDVQIYRKRIVLLTIAMLAPALLGCSTVIDAKDAVFGGTTRIEAKLAAAKDLNPDLDGQPSPLVVRLYALKSATAFNNASFFSLYDSEAAELGADLQNREELEVRPGQKLALERDFKDETRYLGVLAAYRDIDNASWRAVYELREGRLTELKIGLGRLDVTIAKQD